MAKSIYQRLTGRRRRISGYSQLWLAPDHLLMVESSRFSERYRRFALADIQAIAVTELPDRTLWQILALAAAVLWTLALLLVDQRLDRYFFGATGAIAIAVVIADIVRGPRCRCYVYTAVSREVLAPVARMRTARAFLDRIRPAIESVQGTLAPETMAAVPQAAGPEPEAAPEVPAPPGYLPETLFGLFLVNALLVLVSSRFPATNLANVLLTTFFGEFAILIVAMVRRGRDVRRPVYGLMAVALLLMGWDAVHLGRSFFQYLNSVMESGRRGTTVTPTIASWMAFSQSTALFAASWRVVAGMLGLMLAWTERRGIGS